MNLVDKITNECLEEARRDCVGLWEIAAAVREDFGIHDNREVKEKALAVVRRLLLHGLRPGDHPNPVFKFWKESDPDSIIARINKEWDPRNGDPNLGNPICWFDARRP